jgi:hypothetical protein
MAEDREPLDGMSRWFYGGTPPEDRTDPADRAADGTPDTGKVDMPLDGPR